MDKNMQHDMESAIYGLGRAVGEIMCNLEDSLVVSWSGVLNLLTARLVGLRLAHGFKEGLD